MVVDDHAIVRQGLCAILATDPELVVVAEAADGLEACDEALAHGPDVIVMDVSMPRMNGLEATRRILAASPASKVIALTVHDELAYVRELLNAGAQGYVLKRSAVRDLLQAIRVVARGGQFLDPELARGAQSSSAVAAAGKAVDLSAREIDVASLSARGHTQRRDRRRAVACHQDRRNAQDPSDGETGAQDPRAACAVRDLPRLALG